MFETKYKGSEEEMNDIQKIYERFEGDMDKIMSSVMCATMEDEPRICRIIQEMIDAGTVESYRAFTSETKKKREARNRRARREAQMSEKMAQEMKVKQSTAGYASFLPNHIFLMLFFIQ